MKVIVINEEDIQKLMDSLQVCKFQFTRSQLPEEQIYRHFNCLVVEWFHKQGSNYPCT